LSGASFSLPSLPLLFSDFRHDRWDPVEAFTRLEGPAASFDEEEVRRLHVLTKRAVEVTRHRDIVTRHRDDDVSEHRTFEDNGACGVSDDMPPCCNQTCFDLSYCSALNGRRIEDKYYPTLPFIQGSCDNLDDRASRLDVWGDYHTNKPFRDTDECRQLVLDYTCLTWATMFGDRCFNGTNAPRTPCRSFCVQVAMTCANDPFDWVNLCHNVECPMKKGKCSRNSNGTDLTSPGPHGHSNGEGPGQGQAWSNGNVIAHREESYVEGEGGERTKGCWVVKVPSAYSAAAPSARNANVLLAAVASALACALALA
jgi:hypothetical protein